MEDRLNTVQEDTSCRVGEEEVEDTRVWTKKVPEFVVSEQAKYDTN